MTIKKINAICSWIVSLTLLSHAAIMGAFLLTGWSNPSLTKALAHSTAGMVFIHAIISIIIVMFCHDGANFSKYTKLNKKTIVQRASCILIIAVLHLHVNAFEFIALGEPLSAVGKVRLLITELVFFGSVFAHLASSFGNSFVSLGLIRKESTLKKVQKGSAVICSLMMLFIAVSLIKFTVTWVGIAG